jgi:hypothetical protein
LHVASGGGVVIARVLIVLIVASKFIVPSLMLRFPFYGAWGS